MKKLALRGFINLCSKGHKQEECDRKKVSKTLGGPDKVPTNMMPNGRPLSGTTNEDWSEEVKSLIYSSNFF